jgi:acetyltransferase-like isoleucine patch superfamily enzyme
MRFRLAFQILILVLPWPARRFLLNLLFGFRFHRTARIGLSVVASCKLEMSEASRIGSFNMIKGLDELKLSHSSRIGNFNWITAAPKNCKHHYKNNPSRAPELILQSHSAITSMHIIDCSDRVTVGEFSTLAGWGTQIITHSIDLLLSEQTTSPVNIGKYCFIGSRAILLKGSALPDRSVLSAGSVLATPETEEDSLYSGVRAAPVKKLSEHLLYFHRTSGFVY